MAAQGLSWRNGFLIRELVYSCHCSPTCGCRGMLGVVVLGNSILYTLPVTSSALYTCIVCNISITWRLSGGVRYTVVHPSAHLGPKLSVCGWPPRDMNCISDRGGSYFDLYPAKNHWIIHIMVHWCQSPQAIPIWWPLQSRHGLLSALSPEWQQ